MTSVVIYRTTWEDAGGRVLFQEETFTDPGATARSPYGSHPGCFPLTARVGACEVVAVPDDWRLDHTAAVIQLTHVGEGNASRLTAQGVRGRAAGGVGGFRLLSG